MPFRRTPVVLAAAIAAAAAPAALAITADEGPPEHRGPGASQGPGADGPKGEKPGGTSEGVDGRNEGKPSPRARGRVKYELKGVVVRNAHRRFVAVEVLGGNAPLKAALGGGQAADEGPDHEGAPESDAGVEVGGELRVKINRRTVVLTRPPGRAAKPGRPKVGKPDQDEPKVDKPEDARAHEGGERRRQGARRAGYRALRKGDKIVVTWIARRGLRAAALPAARRIVDHGPHRADGPKRAKPTGVHTTNSDGTAAFVRRYASADAVFLNGGRTCALGKKRVTPLSDGVYGFQVTAGDGETLLSSSTVDERSFTVEDGAVRSATAPSNPLACGTEGAVVMVGPFEASEDGVYKLWVSKKTDIEDGRFDHRKSAKLVFRVEGATGEPAG